MSQRADAASEPELGEALLAIARTAIVPSSRLIDEGIVDAIPELRTLRETPQDPQWHPEGDVLVHSLWAADLAAVHADAQVGVPDRREIVVLGALLHDIGKPQTTRVREGRLTSYGHAERGSVIARSLGDRLALPRPLIEAVAALCATHMAHVSVQGEPTARAVRRLIARLDPAGVTLDEWAIVVRADGEARGSAARSDAAAPWLRVAQGLGG